MSKTLLKNHDDFRCLIAILGFHGRTATDDSTRPRQYPCVAVWDIEESSDGPSYLEVDFVYLDDFEN